METRQQINERLDNEFAMKERMSIEIKMLEEEKQLQENRIVEFSLHGRNPSDADFKEMRVILENRQQTISKLNLLKRMMEWR